MSNRETDRKPLTAWQLLAPEFAWLKGSVRWRTLFAVAAMLGFFAVGFVLIGGVPIAADRPDGWLMRNVLHFTFKRSVANSAERGLTKPEDFDAPSRVKLGAQHFELVCANCHGVPGRGQSVTALSMSPRPQYLPHVVGQFTDNELHVIVAHGVKFSAMPSWATSDRGDEVWSIVSFLRQLPNMDGKTYAELTALPKTGPIPGADAVPEAPLVPANALGYIEPPKDEFSYSAPAHGFFDPSVTTNPTATCARCHGADGTGAATGGEAPNLTIQNADYLKKSLEAYVSGMRKSGYMQTVAAQLSQSQITALANHYAGLPVRTFASAPPDPALVARGEAIATQGLPARAIAACANCHDSAGTQVINAPHIAGQSDVYLRRELNALRQYGRGSTLAWNPMSAEAHQLGDSEIAALAAFYSSQKPVKGGGAPMAPAPVKAGDVAAAKAIFENRCIKCHLNDGRGDTGGSTPNLTIQSAPYAAQTLYSFRTGARESNKMLEVTGELSLDQLANLAAYVGSLTPQPSLTNPDPAAAKRGQTIAANGIPSRGVPACLSCHDAKGIAALPLIPYLQGQSVVYLRERLDTFVHPESASLSKLNPMPGIASKLTEAERADLAAYFAAEKPVAK